MDARGLRQTTRPLMSLHAGQPPTDSSNKGGEERPRPQYGHGRRLIQMLFRSNNDEDTRHQQPQESHGLVPTSPVALLADARSEDDLPVGSNTLSALKRKLFPARKRRHPARIPPLVISPIASGPERAMDNNSDDVEAAEDDGVNEAPPNEEHGQSPEPHDADGDDGDIDDDLLEAIMEADRLQSAASDETLLQMNRAIEELHQWKEDHERATQMALRAVEEKLERALLASKSYRESDSNEEVLISEAERNQRVAEVAREKLSIALKETERAMASRRPEDEEVVRVLREAERTSGGEIDEVNASRHLSKLREEVFDLGVKELSSAIQSKWMQELEVADNELDMKMVDVEAFASQLDSVLAQFDVSSAVAEEQNPAGQAAQEH